MSKFQILSDLHLEFYGKRAAEALKEIPVAAPHLILAGDSLRLSTEGLQWSDALMGVILERWQYVYYVPGNHEFYGHTSIKKGLRELKMLARRHPRWFYLGMHKPVYLPDGLRIWGDTMWFSKPPPYLNYAVNDFYQITDFSKTVHDAHKKFVKDLNRVKPDIVVTHHLPSLKSVNGFYTHDSTNWAYVAEMDNYIEKWQPKLWVHGHTHDPTDYMHGTTRVVCNPWGYPGRTSPGFRPALVVDVEA